MYERRRSFLKVGVAAAGALALPASLAQKPGRPLAKLVIGVPAGSALDITARAVADGMRGKYAETIIIENKPGAGGRIGLDQLKRSPADGSVFSIVPSSFLTVYPHIYTKLDYTLSDFVPAAVMGRFTTTMAVGPSVPESVKTPEGFAEWAKKQRGGQVNFSGNNPGTPSHFMGLQFGKRFGLNMSFIPFKAGSDSSTALMAGEFPLGFYTDNYVADNLKTGRIRALAVCSEVRSPRLPSTPTFKELGVADLTTEEWLGLYLPKGTAPAIADELYARWRDAAQTQRIKDLIPGTATEEGPAQAAKLLEKELAYYAQVVRASGVKFEN